MTGGGRGFCILRLPNRPGEPVVGAGGRMGRPVGRTPQGEDELAILRRQADRIEAILRAIRGRIERLEATLRQKTIGG